MVIIINLWGEFSEWSIWAGHQGKQQKQDREGGDAALGSMDCGTSSAAQIILDTCTVLCIKSWQYYELISKHTVQIIHKSFAFQCNLMHLRIKLCSSSHSCCDWVDTQEQWKATQLQRQVDSLNIAGGGEWKLHCVLSSRQHCSASRVPPLAKRDSSSWAEQERGDDPVSRAGSKPLCCR